MFFTCSVSYATLEEYRWEARQVSKRFGRDWGSDPLQEPLVWERVTWRQGDGCYSFEVAEGGLLATMRSPHGQALTLPMVAWDGLLDALAGARKTRTRNERGFPARSGARWYEGEAGELAAAFKAGRTIAQLARAHNRSEFAVEAQLDRMGLWDRVERRALVQAEGFQRPLQDGQPNVGRGTPIPLAGDRD
jgi:hypothetical protein